MERNGELIRAVAERIHSHPEQYDQTEWGMETECGTVACLAGHTLLASGMYTLEGLNFFNQNGRMVMPRAEATELLGLTHNETDALFAVGWGPTRTNSTEEAIEQIRKELYRISYGGDVFTPIWLDS